MIEREYMKALGKVIREARRTKRLTRTGLQYRTRICYPTLAKMERGTVDMRMDTLFKVCEALDLKPSELFTLVEERL